MLNKKNILIVLLICLIGAGLFAAEQVTKVGIVDSQKVALSYISKSTAYKELEDLKSEFEDKMESIAAELKALQADRLEAVDEGDDRLVLELDKQILEKREYQVEYKLYMEDKIANQKKMLINVNDEFYLKITKAIADTAVAEGMSLVLDSTKVKIFYYDDAIDITDAVIAALSR